MRRIIGLAVMLVFLPSAAAADVSSKAADDDQRIVCKSQARANSRLPKKTCMTKAQWDDLAEQHKRDAKEWIDRPQIETRRD